MADIDGTGAIQSMWFTGYVGRDFILRIYWDGQERPSVECPLSDFFGMPWVTNDMIGTKGPYAHLGEIKFYIDGDEEYPTICGTGTEDYFGGAYNWDVDGQYREYSTPYAGMHQVLRPDGTYRSQHRHSMYRWHVVDPIRFEADLKVTIQALGWRSEGRYYPGQHDICSVAYWYQTLPAASFPKLPDRNELEII